MCSQLDTILRMKELIEIQVYETEIGKQPFNIWFDELDVSERLIIDNRLARVRAGNIGACGRVHPGLGEIIIDHGSGYRIYYAKIGKTTLLILNAGIKRSQELDIKKAREYWLDYKEKNREKSSKL